MFHSGRFDWTCDLRVDPADSSKHRRSCLAGGRRIVISLTARGVAGDQAVAVRETWVTFPPEGAQRGAKWLPIPQQHIGLTPDPQYLATAHQQNAAIQQGHPPPTTVLS